MRAVKGPVGTLIEAKLGAKGFTTLGWMELGTRNVTNSRRPLRKLDDFQGLKIRMPPSEIFLATFRAPAANPAVINLNALYGALRHGDLDSTATPPSVLRPHAFSHT